MQEGIGTMIPCTVIGNINDKEFEAQMKKEQEESERREG